MILSRSLWGKKSRLYGSTVFAIAVDVEGRGGSVLLLSLRLQAETVRNGVLLNTRLVNFTGSPFFLEIFEGVGALEGRSEVCDLRREASHGCQKCSQQAAMSQ